MNSSFLLRYNLIPFPVLTIIFRYIFILLLIIKFLNLLEIQNLILNLEIPSNSISIQVSMKVVHLIMENLINMLP